MRRFHGHVKFPDPRGGPELVFGFGVVASIGQWRREMAWTTERRKLDAA